MSSREFEDISIPKWKLSLNGVETAAQTIYRVFSSKTEFVTIEAASATEAAAKSGLPKILMIKIGVRDDMTMLDRTMLTAAKLAEIISAPVPPVEPIVAP